MLSEMGTRCGRRCPGPAALDGDVAFEALDIDAHLIEADPATASDANLIETGDAWIEHEIEGLLRA